MTLQDAVANSFSHGGRRYWKELRFLSGNAGTFANLSGLVDRGVSLLQKLFLRDMLLRKVREMLDSQEGVQPT
jgi:hypothetical protein